MRRLTCSGGARVGLSARPTVGEHVFPAALEVTGPVRWSALLLPLIFF